MELHGKPFVESELYEYLKNKERRHTVAKLPTDYKQTEEEAFKAAHKDGDLESVYHFIYEKPFTNTIGGI